LINIGAYPAGSSPVIDQAIIWQETLQKSSPAVRE